MNNYILDFLQIVIKPIINPTKKMIPRNPGFRPPGSEPACKAADKSKKTKTTAIDAIILEVVVIIRVFFNYQLCCPNTKNCIWIRLVTLLWLLNEEVSQSQIQKKGKRIYPDAVSGNIFSHNNVFKSIVINKFNNYKVWKVLIYLESPYLCFHFGVYFAVRFMRGCQGFSALRCGGLYSQTFNRIPNIEPYSNVS